MHLSDRERFSKLLIGLGEVYGKSISPLLVKLYWQVLESFLFCEVIKAFEMHLQDPNVGQFMPKPADVIRILQGDSHTQSLKAWSKVEQGIRQVGPYRTVAFDDPTIHVVLQEMGGWIKICQTSEKELPFVAKEFQNRFQGYRHLPAKAYPKHFAGINEHQNQLQGFGDEAVVLIGEQYKAQELLNHHASVEKIISIDKLGAHAIPRREDERTSTTVS